MPVTRRPTLIWSRLGGVLLLRPQRFAEIAADPSAGPQAGILVLAASALEAASGAALHDDPMPGGGELLLAELAALIGWALWSILIHTIGVRFAGYRAELAAVVRAIGFAHAPSLILAIGLVPGAALTVGTLYVIALLWFAAALVAAVRGVFSLPFRPALVLAGGALLAHELVRQAMRFAGLSP